MIGITILQRKVIQIASIPESDNCDGFIFALCDDGSMWSRVMRDDPTWIEIEKIPQPTKEKEQ